VGASGPAAAATPAETVAVKGTGDRGTEIAQLQRINNNLESYLQKGNNQKNLPTQIESLERLNNHLTGGGTWDNAPDELKTSFINMRGDIKPEKLKPSDLQKEITGTIKVANLVVKENFNLAHARATLISDLQRSLRTGAPIEISPQTSRHITNTVHLINIRRQININPATTIDSLSSGLRGLTGVQLGVK